MSIRKSLKRKIYRSSPVYLTRRDVYRRGNGVVYISSGSFFFFNRFRKFFIARYKKFLKKIDLMSMIWVKLGKTVYIFRKSQNSRMGGGEGSFFTTRRYVCCGSSLARYYVNRAGLAVFAFKYLSSKAPVPCLKRRFLGGSFDVGKTINNIFIKKKKYKKIKRNRSLGYLYYDPTKTESFCFRVRFLSRLKVRRKLTLARLLRKKRKMKKLFPKRSFYDSFDREDGSAMLSNLRGNRVSLLFTIKRFLILLS